MCKRIKKKINLMSSPDDKNHAELSQHAKC